MELKGSIEMKKSCTGLHGRDFKLIALTQDRLLLSPSDLPLTTTAQGQ